MSLSAHLARVEEYGYDRSSFPVEYNGHNITIVHNDTRVIDAADERIHVHLLLWCSRCNEGDGVRGSAYADELLDDEMRIVKFKPFHHFVTHECA